MPTLKDFIARIVPWPAPAAPGVVNIHWKMKHSQSGEMIWAGRPTNTPDQFVGLVDWAIQRPQTFTEIYYCMSMQGRVGRSKNGNPSVARSQADALALRSIWLDIDVKDPPKGYATLDEAKQALAVFLKAYTLPFPTALVASGGGLHVYWTSDKDLSPDEWRPYAEGLRTAAVQHGLRCDAGVTVDSARILRVPGTFNNKIAGQPRPVQLLHLEPADLNFATALKHLSLIAPTTPAVVTVAVTPAFDLSAFAGKKPSAAWAALDPSESLGAGIEHNHDPLDPTPILSKDGCPYFRDAFATHGKDAAQGLWMLTVLASTFWQNGDTFAHELSNGHPGYKADETDAMIERKEREKVQRGLGWPSCASFEREGCTFCKGCPHKGKIRSPLNLALVHKKQPVNIVTTQQLAQKSAGLDLPPQYAVDPKSGVVCEIITVENKGQSPIQELLPLFLSTSKFTAPFAQRDPHVLYFTTTADMGHYEKVAIPYEAMLIHNDLMRVLGRCMVKPNMPQAQRLGGFFVAWINELHAKQAAIQSKPFGWCEDEHGKITGFAAGGVTTNIDGSQNAAGYADHALREAYTPRGDTQTWYEAMKIVTDQQRPELELLVAAAFAAPLMQFAGNISGATYSAVGPSGGNKSSAACVGMSVWGHPVDSKDTPSSSVKSVEGKMGWLKNLPLYWDEVKDKVAQQKVYDGVFNLSEGATGNKMNPDRSLKQRYKWKTNLTICSNYSFTDFMISDLHVSAAALYRVFEFEVPIPPVGGPGRMATYDAGRVLQRLEGNFGQIGLLYSKYLATHLDYVDQFTRDCLHTIATKMKQRGDNERYWVALCGTALAGATIANKEFNAGFHIPELLDFMLAQYEVNRMRADKDGSDNDSASSFESVLTDFLKHYTAHSVFTNEMPAPKGKPRAITIIYGPPATNPRPVHVHCAIEDRVIRISRKEFSRYLVWRKSPVSSTIAGLERYFHAEQKYLTLAAGTPYRRGQEYVIELPVPVGSPLEASLNAYGGLPENPAPPPTDQPPTTPTTPTTPIDTALAGAMAQAAADLETVKRAA